MSDKKEIKKAVEEVKKELLEEEVKEVEEEKKQVIEEAKEKIKEKEEEEKIKELIEEEAAKKAETQIAAEKEIEYAPNIGEQKKEEGAAYYDKGEPSKETTIQAGLEQGAEGFGREAEKLFSETPGSSDDLRERYLEQTGKIPAKIIDSEDITRKELKKAHLGKK